MIISVTYMPLSGLEKNSVLIGNRSWHQTNPVPDLHVTRTATRNRCQKNGADLWAPISAAYVMGIRVLSALC